MKFKVEDKKKHSDIEKEIIADWKKNKTFEKSVEQRDAKNAFRFDDGPPFITGMPHHGHLLVSTVKDSVARYHTMQGKRVERRWGWDCHGLPAEVKVEEKLGITDRSEIGTKISVQDYVASCREAMVQGSMAWNNTVDRIGRWVDMSNPYRTMDKEYMESVWWAFKTLHDKGKIYEGEKVLVYCTRDATPISKSEVAMENAYKEVTDPSVFAYFKLADQIAFNNTYLLAWTTTPWTLPANVALAVNPAIEYVLVEYNNKKLILAKELVEKVFVNEKKQPLEYSVLGDFDIDQLVGQRYEPILENHGANAQKIVAAGFVSAQDGTGVVHIAPAYGEDDFELSQKEGLPVVHMVDEVGVYASGRWQGSNIWEVNKDIAKTLVAEDRALKVEYIKHEYPHCHRCGTKLMYRAHSSWFMDIQTQKDEMIAENNQSNWVPAAIKEKRFNNILVTAPDWNLSRDRFWATPIPVWKGKKADGVEVVKVFGSYQEFEDSTGLDLEDYHLPMVMNVEFELEGVTMRHIGKVIDCWFESGSVPFAQYHYPFENQEKFESTFPADFITESIDQTRGWFYSLTAVNVGLFGKMPFKNLICTGFINAADGQKLSKKLKNYTEPTDLMDKTSADAERLFFLNSPLVNGEDASLSDKDVETMQRKLTMLRNVYDFFVMYASVDGWDSEVAFQNGKLAPPESENILDKWIVSRLYQLMAEVEEGMYQYKLHEATRGITPFLDDLSNWFVRRSRKRFWKSENDGDKAAAYHTLYYILVEFSKVLAPFSPFISEYVYQKLTGEESVHLADWPVAGDTDESLLQEMKDVRKGIESGLSLRATENIKVRQPLALARVWMTNMREDTEIMSQFTEIIKEELNTKRASLSMAISDGDEGRVFPTELDLEITPELKREGMMREIIRFVQTTRKEAGFSVDDRINLVLITKGAELLRAIEEHKETIAKETLGQTISVKGDVEPDGHINQVEVDGVALKISVMKATG